ncbi:IQ domain-containing protein [Schistosoma japonicum]|nr:IQ domain-containing protein [Schistosoma japonicum]KAH8860895.1 IQ domain-containing protein [Schistosoma japonicum]
MNLERRIPCQKMTFIRELMPLSRHIESPISTKVLAILDTALQKILTVLCIQDIVENIENDKSILDHMKSYLSQTEKYDSMKTGDRNNFYLNKSLSKNGELPKGNEQETNVCLGHNLDEEFENKVRHFLYSMQSQPLINKVLAGMIFKNGEQLANDRKLPETITNFVNSVKWINVPQFTQNNKTKLVKYLIHLRTLLLTKLLTTPEDEKRKKIYIKELKTRDRECQTKLDELIKELDSQVCANNTESRKIGYTISKLQNEIDNLEKYLTERKKQINTEEEKKITEITEQNNTNENSLNKEIKNQEILLEKLIETNRSEEEAIRATIYKIESDIESKISKYDQEMTVLQDEYDVLKAEYTEEKNAYDELNERFQIINEEYQKIMEERRVEEERRTREEEQRRQMEQAVTTIQAFWRSFKTRRMARGKKGGSRRAKK